MIKQKRMKIYHLSNERIKVTLLYFSLICLIYPQVVFLGRSLIPSLYYPKQFNPPGYEGIEPVNTFNIDLGTPSFYEVPINRLIGKMYLKGMIPLWNPYQGCGMPLLAQYSTRALFPYQVLENISPWWLWDYFILGRLLIAGFFTFLFLRLFGLSFVSSFLGGIFYMFSGSFTWFINLEQFTNVAMTIPIFIYSLERIYKFKNFREIGISSISLFLVLSSGQPETASYVCLLGFLYYIFRVKASLKNYLRFIAVIFLGTGMSLPIILPFIEFVKNSYNAHPFMPKSAVHMGIVSPTSFKAAISLFVPTFFQVPTFFRINPTNGVWDCLGGYIPISCLYLSILGLFFKNKNRKFIIFFFVLGISIILKNFGVLPFKLLGYLPLFNQSWSPRWAGCVWVFCLSIAGAIGFEVISSSVKNKNPPSIILTIIFISIILFFWRSKLIQKWDELPALLKNFYISSALLGTAISFLLIIFIFSFIIFFRDKKLFSLSIIILVIGEVWFYIPKGFSYLSNMFCILPLFMIITASILIIKNKKRAALIMVAFSFISIILLNLLSPYGFPKRKNPFPERPFIKFLKNNLGHYRVMNTESILFPNFASSFSLNDVRYISSISITWYQHFVESFLLGTGYYSWEATKLWFTGIPLDNNRTQIYNDLVNNLKFYSILSVKFIVTPKDINLNLPLIYNDEVKVYENPYCLPRAYVVHNILYTENWEKAQEMLNNINPRETVILEEEKKLNSPSQTFENNSWASILEYLPSKIILDVKLEKNGVLVLTDTFYPGWQAYVNGKERMILRVQGLFKGVSLEKGRYSVIMVYKPKTFFIASILGFLFLTLSILLIVRDHWTTGIINRRPECQ